MILSFIRDRWKKGWEKLQGIPEPLARKLSLGLWILLAVVAATIVAVQPGHRTVTPEYREASEKWWSSEPAIYKGKSGFLYLPHAAMLYTPFTLPPDRIGEPLWRLTMLAMLALALWTASKRFAPERVALLFVIATILVLPSALASARNGQVNMPLAALYLLAAIAAADRRWWLSGCILVLSLAMKPISIVPILLVAVCYPRTIIPLLVCTAGLLASAFLHPSPSYVAVQYREFFESLLRTGRPTHEVYADIAGIFHKLGLPLPEAVGFGLRLLFAPLILAICLLAVKKWDPLRAAFAVLAFAAVYLMVFNPRTETNSYIILGVFVGIWGAYEGAVARNLRAAAWLVLLAVLLGTENYANPIHPWTNLWLKPLATSVFGLSLAWKVLRSRPGEFALMKPPSASVVTNTSPVAS